MASFSHSKVLFVNDDGIPIQFYMTPGSTRHKLKPYVEYGGGVISNKEVGDKVIKLAAPGNLVKTDDFVHSKYVMDCVEENQLLDVQKYRLKKGDTCQSSDDEWLNEPDNIVIHGEARSKRGRNKYFFEDDSSIIKYLLDEGLHENVKGNKIWMTMEKDRVVRGHTWQSLKHRYLKTILPNIAQYKLKSQDVIRLTGAVTHSSGSNDEISPRKPVISLRNREQPSEDLSSPETSPVKKLQKTPNGISDAEDQDADEVSIHKAASRVQKEDADKDIDVDEFDIHLLQQALGLNEDKSKTRDETPGKRGKASQETNEDKLSEHYSTKTQQIKKTSDLLKIKNHKVDNEILDESSAGENSEGCAESRKRKLSDGQMSQPSKCSKTVCESSEDRSNMARKLSLRSGPRTPCKSSRTVDNREDESKKSESPKRDKQQAMHLRSSHLKGTPESKIAHTTEEKKDLSLKKSNKMGMNDTTVTPKKRSMPNRKAASKTATPSKSSAVELVLSPKATVSNMPKPRGRPPKSKKTVVQKSDELETEESKETETESQPEVIVGSVESDEHGETQVTNKHKQIHTHEQELPPTNRHSHEQSESKHCDSSALSIEDIFDPEMNTVNNETIQDFIMGEPSGSNYKSGRGRDKQALETIKSICSCLELSPVMFMDPLYRVCGDVQEAIHWILHDKTRGAHLWSKQQDALLSRDRAHLIKNVAIEEIRKREKFLGLS